ncbi:MAG: glycoside hydrolase family 3 protein, partial [Bacteroidales bacterium]|nr:glycoside hydrolase family 3 protein [Bacteroidales bacterium]
MNRLQARAQELIQQMTLEEKCAQLMNETPSIERLGIRPYDYWNEGLHGVGRSGRATVYPEPIGLGATFDPELVERIGDAVAEEGRAKYCIAQKQGNYNRYSGLTYWSPNVNIFRDPRWGRGMETYGEDPYLTGQLGVAYVHGLQGNDPVYLKTSACAKHFAVHSGPESTRHEADIHPSMRDLYETYLPAFRTLVEGGVESVMMAYNAVNESPCSSNIYLMHLLRKQWGFNGHIVSDCGAVDDIYQGHGVVPTAAEASALAIKAGLNLECGSTFHALGEALEKGLITEQDIDKALLPVLLTRLKLGIIDQDPACPYNNVPEEVICSEAHTQLALRAAKESMVLLKNTNGLLPLRKDTKRIYVTGEGATEVYNLMGNYYGLS